MDVVRFYGTLQNLAEYERDILSAKFIVITRLVSPDSLLGVSSGICQTDLVDESGTIRTQLVTCNRQKMVAMDGTLYTIPPRNSIQYVQRNPLRTEALLVMEIIKHCTAQKYKLR
jgi:hypothetical protein